MNIFRNKLMALASYTTITASLILFGVFIIVIVNLEYNTRELVNQPQMKVFCETVLEIEDIAPIEREIQGHPQVESYELLDKRSAFETAKEWMGNEDTLLEGVGENFLPIAFNVKLKNPESSFQLAEFFRQIPGVQKVSYEQKTIDYIMAIVSGIKYFSAFLMILLSIGSVVIISNTIRVAMSSRKREINIMKYIGATDGFIRLPFIIEGFVIGLIGSVGGFFIVTYAYQFLIERFGHKVVLITFVDPAIIAREIIPIYLVLGLLVGTIGSLVSIRRYLRV